MKHNYNKLVRDKIPSIIESTGRTCHYKELSDEVEIRSALCNKLIEKANAFSEKQTEDEISDLYAVLDALVAHFDFEPMHIDYLKMQNAEKKGSYSGNTFLIDVEDNQ